MSTKHTSGPWRYEAPDEVSIKDADGGRVAILTNLRGALGMGGRRDPNEVIANARLIAAAPELLAELRIVYDRSYNPFEPDNQSEQYKRVGALIAKATGATP